MELKVAIVDSYGKLKYLHSVSLNYFWWVILKIQGNNYNALYFCKARLRLIESNDSWPNLYYFSSTVIIIQKAQSLLKNKIKQLSTTKNSIVPALDIAFEFCVVIGERA